MKQVHYFVAGNYEPRVVQVCGDLFRAQLWSRAALSLWPIRSVSVCDHHLVQQPRSGARLLRVSNSSIFPSSLLKGFMSVKRAWSTLKLPPVDVSLEPGRTSSSCLALLIVLVHSLIHSHKVCIPSSVACLDALGLATHRHTHTRCLPL